MRLTVALKIIFPFQYFLFPLFDIHFVDYFKCPLLIIEIYSLLSLNDFTLIITIARNYGRKLFNNLLLINPTI